MFDLSFSDVNSEALAVPKLRDDGSNWADYESRIRKALGAKGVWRHVEGTAACPPEQYAIINNVYVLPDGKTPATEDQIEAREDKIEAYERKSFLAQHIILSTTSYRLGAKFRNLTTAKEMWDIVVADTTTKSSLYLIDAEDQLAKMRCHDDPDAKTHYADLQGHFELMARRHENLIKMGSVISDTRFSAMIMSSLPPSYRPALQTITAASKASKSTMLPTELIAFFTEEAHHRVIAEDRANQAQSALYARTHRGRKSPEHDESSDSESDSDSDSDSDDSESSSSSESSDEEEKPSQKRKSSNRETKPVESAGVAVDEELYAFTCTSDHAAATESLKVPIPKFDVVVDSRADQHICPDRTKFSKFHEIPDRIINTSDGHTFKAIGKGDVHLDLPNGSGSKRVLLRDVIYTPEILSTVISVNRLTKGKCSVLFENKICTIKYPTGHIMATLPTSNGLYRVLTTKTDNIKLVNNRTTRLNDAKRTCGTSYNKGSDRSQIQMGNQQKYSPIESGGDTPHCILVEGEMGISTQYSDSQVDSKPEHTKADSVDNAPLANTARDCSLTAHVDDVADAVTKSHIGDGTYVQTEPGNAKMDAHTERGGNLEQLSTQGQALNEGETDTCIQYSKTLAKADLLESDSENRPNMPMGPHEIKPNLSVIKLKDEKPSHLRGRSQFARKEPFDKSLQKPSQSMKTNGLGSCATPSNAEQNTGTNTAYSVCNIIGDNSTHLSWRNRRGCQGDQDHRKPNFHWRHTRRTYHGKQLPVETIRMESNGPRTANSARKRKMSKSGILAKVLATIPIQNRDPNFQGRKFTRCAYQVNY